MVFPWFVHLDLEKFDFGLENSGEELDNCKVKGQTWQHYRPYTVHFRIHLTSYKYCFTSSQSHDIPCRFPRLLGTGTLLVIYLVFRLNDTIVS